jgi:hypothetical protein
VWRGLIRRDQVCEVVHGNLRRLIPLWTDLSFKKFGRCRENHYDVIVGGAVVVTASWCSRPLWWIEGPFYESIDTVESPGGATRG